LVRNNCRIGANAIVYTDILANSVVVAAPTLIIQKEKLDNRYFTQRENKWVYYDNGYWKESDTLPSLRNF
jgi:serine acetyltransferase